jgi:hypothetical protein
MRERAWVGLVAILAAILLVSVLIGTIGWSPGLAALAGMGIGALPWFYDTSTRLLAARKRTRVAREALASMVADLQASLPALIRPDRKEGETEAVGEALAGGDPAEVVQAVAEYVVAKYLPSSTIDLIGAEVLNHLVLHLSAQHLGRSLELDARATVRAYIGAQIKFAADGPSLSSEGETFAKFIVFLNEKGPVSDAAAFREFLDHPLSTRQRNEIAVQLSDPPLSFIIHDLGKSDDLMALVRQRMSGGRLMQKLTQRARKRQTGESGRFGAFLVVGSRNSPDASSRNYRYADPPSDGGPA